VTGDSSTSKPVSIWWFAFGYFACYVPYSALTKALSSGLPAKMRSGISGFELLPWSTLVSLVAMMAFISAMGWWKHAGRRQVLGVTVPAPNRWTLLSGVCTAAIIGTTTLAYTFAGVSIVFMMLLMRGGVLVLAPVVDAISGRQVRWFSWVGLLLSLGALIAAFLKDMGFDLTAVAAVDVALYLASYFVRLRFMSRLAKSDDEQARLRYFVEEQMVATPVVVAALATLAVLGQGDVMMSIRAGYTSVFDQGIFAEVVLIGLFSQGTGIFGGLLLLDRQENTFCVPVNRSSSVLAGVVASYSLTFFFGKAPPSGYEIAGAGLIVTAIVLLTVASSGGRRPEPPLAPAEQAS
jgi:hypothetical protein